MTVLKFLLAEFIFVALLCGCISEITPMPSATQQYRFFVAVTDEDTQQPVTATIKIWLNNSEPRMSVAQTVSITTTVGAILNVEVFANGYITNSYRGAVVGEVNIPVRLNVRLKREGTGTRVRG